MLTSGTRLVGLIGNPLSRSLSPRMQNAAFAARGLDWAYVPLPVAPERLEAALAGLAALGFAGANVTIPYKTAVLAYCDALDPFAERAGSANTIVVAGDGHLSASSTDGLAVTDAVAARGAHALVLGAGGAAQAVATALADAGAERITVAGRDPERAHGLVVRLRTLFPERDVEAAEVWPPPLAGATILVNATPVTGETIVEPLARCQVVDLAYRADCVPTALAEAGRRAGARVVDGLEVLVRQGAASYERWTGIPAPVDVMRAAVGA